MKGAKVAFMTFSSQFPRALIDEDFTSLIGMSAKGVISNLHNTALTSKVVRDESKQKRQLVCRVSRAKSMTESEEKQSSVNLRLPTMLALSFPPFCHNLDAFLIRFGRLIILDQLTKLAVAVHSHLYGSSLQSARQ